MEMYRFFFGVSMAAGNFSPRLHTHCNLGFRTSKILGTRNDVGFSEDNTCDGLF